MAATHIVKETDLRKMRYQLALHKFGRAVMRDIFCWTYQGGFPISEYLLARPGYSNAQFRKDFNTHQRHQLENDGGAGRPDKFDVSLLYRLVQEVCGLADTSTWPQPATSLEHRIYCLKQLRNEAAHEDHQFTEEVFNNKLLNLQQLVEDIYYSSCSKFGKTGIYQAKLMEVKMFFSRLREKIIEPLTPSDRDLYYQLQQQMRVFRCEVRKQMKTSGRQELQEQYRNLCRLDPAPWLQLGVTFRPSMAITQLVIAEDKLTTARQVGPQPRVTRPINYQNLLSVKCKNGQLPQFITVIGDGGIGKTTLVMYILEKWCDDPKAMKGLDEVELILYAQCRDSRISSYEQLLKLMLNKTIHNSDTDFEFFKTMVKETYTLVILDSYEEVNDCSEDLVRDIISQAGDRMRIVVTVRPSSVARLAPVIPAGKNCLNLVVNGIPQDMQLQLVCNLINILDSDSSKRAMHESGLEKMLTFLKPKLGEHLSNPLTLTLLVLLWMESPSRVHDLTSTTQVYCIIRNHLTLKLIANLTAKGVKKAAAKVGQFLRVFDDTALATLKRQEFELSGATVQALEKACDDLNLSHEDVFSACLKMNRVRHTDLTLIPVWSFLHLRFQEYAAARSIARKLSECGDSAEDNLLEQLLTDECKTPATNLQERRHSGIIRHRDSLCSMVQCLTGVLADIDDPQQRLLHRHAKHILRLFQQLDRGNTRKQLDRLLTLIVESKYNSTVVREVATVLLASPVWYSQGTSLGALPVLLNHSTAVREVTLHYLGDPASCPNLHEAVGALARNHIAISLICRYTYKHKDISFSMFARAPQLTNSRSNDSLQTVCVDSCTSSWPAPSWSSPALHLSPGSAAPTPPMQEIVITVRGAVPPGDRVPRLPITSRELAFFLHCHAKDSDAGRLSDLVGSLYDQHRPGTATLELWQSCLSRRGLEALLWELARGGVRLVSLRLVSSPAGLALHTRLSPADQAALVSLAQQTRVGQLIFINSD